ncbi:MAG: TIGR00730 family Rossman fold protein [Bacteroidota bacterium]|nr:TIGR00730 family Rossman fold protein [Bacteroidota bacterium]
MNICVFCSSSNGIRECFFEDAAKLGRLIGEHGHSLVNGGSNVGLMEATAKAAREAGAKVTGVIPRLIHDHHLATDSAHELIVTENMRDRKYLLRKRSDAFIALPGGFGTLEEILEVITLKQLHYHNKPVVFINSANFYSSLFAQFENAYNENFAKAEYRKLYYVADDVEDAIRYIESYNPEELSVKWFNVPDR